MKSDGSTRPVIRLNMLLMKHGQWVGGLLVSGGRSID